MSDHANDFRRVDEGLSRPQKLAAAALEQLKKACLHAGLTEEELESNEKEVREEIATNGRYTPPNLKGPPIEEPA